MKPQKERKKERKKEMGREKHTKQTLFSKALLPWLRQYELSASVPEGWRRYVWGFSVRMYTWIWLTRNPWVDFVHT